MRSFNLIVSTFRFREEDAEDEIMDFLEDLGDPEAGTEISSVSGLVLCDTELDPFAVVEKIIGIVRSEPWQVRFILRAIPVEVVVNTDLDQIAQACASLCQKKMSSTETFRITVEKRHCDSLSSKDIISGVADKIQNKVKLENPDWIVLVEIIGKVSGISVVKDDQIFRSMKEKRK